MFSSINRQSFVIAGQIGTFRKRLSPALGSEAPKKAASESLLQLPFSLLDLLKICPVRMFVGKGRCWHERHRSSHTHFTSDVLCPFSGSLLLQAFPSVFHV